MQDGSSGCGSGEYSSLSRDLTSTHSNSASIYPNTTLPKRTRLLRIPIFFQVILGGLLENFYQPSLPVGVETIPRSVALHVMLRFWSVFCIYLSPQLPVLAEIPRLSIIALVEFQAE
jgi:hypothetical protein